MRKLKEILPKAGWQPTVLVLMGLGVILIFVLVVLKLTSQPSNIATSDFTTPHLTPAQTAKTNANVAEVVGADTLVHGPLYGIITSKVVNLRSGPSVDATVISSLKLGQIVQLTHRTGSWYQTEQGYWISALYLEVRQSVQEAQAYSAELQRP
jgi:uncharacterized protein YgiM (DUF1202 family)